MMLNGSIFGRRGYDMSYSLRIEMPDKVGRKISISKALSLADNGNVGHIQETSDMSQTIRELNDDASDRDGFSKIDMKSRLTNDEISAILTIDALINMKVFPEEVRFLTTTKKRISPSLEGKGRDEVVKIAQGMQQQQSGHSILDGIGNMFRGGNRQ